MEINYSLIIPHYNLTTPLLRLLESIPKRNDLQIILVDDCSNDSDKIILNETLKRYPYIEFYSTVSNGGGGKARNIGIKHALGKYLIFADADDYFTPCFNEALDRYIDTQYDLIYFNCNAVDNETYENSNRANHLGKLIRQYYGSNDVTGLKFRFTQPWAKFIKKSLVDNYNITFEESIISNDVRFSTLCDYYASNLHADIHAIYCTTHRNKSVSHILTPERAIIRLAIDGNKWYFMHQHNIATTPIYFYIGESLEVIINSGNNIIISKACEICNAWGISKRKMILMGKKAYYTRKAKHIVNHLTPSWFKALIFEG